MVDKQDEVVFDFKGVLKFLNKHKVLLLLLIPLILAFYLRVMPAYLPITDSWAKTSVTKYYEDQLKSQVNAQYPNLPEANKNAIIKPQLDKILSEKNGEISSQIATLSKQFKAHFQDDTGQTYLIAIDPWMQYRATRNLLDHGHVGDELKDGKPWNNHMVAPIGTSATVSLHHYIGATLYKLFRVFKPESNLMTAFFYIPVVMSLFAVIPAFFIAKRFGGNIAGFFASMLVAVHPAFLTRTVGGFSDTDVYNVVFPLLIVWFIIMSYDAKTIKNKLIFAGLSGLLTGLFAFAWAGWWYVFDFILASIVIYIAYLFVLKYFADKKLDFTEIKNVISQFLVYFLSSFLFVMLFKNYRVFINAFRGPLNFISIQSATHASLWPNVYTTVAELNTSSISTIVNQIGGKFLFAFSIFSITLMLINTRRMKSSDYIVMGFSALWIMVLMSFMRSASRIWFLLGITVPLILGIYFIIKDKKKIDFKIAALLIIWFVGTIYASTNGIRFVLLLVPAFSLAVGIGVGIMYEFLMRWIVKDMKINKMLSSVVVFSLFLLLLYQPTSSAFTTAKNEVPSMNDAWWAALTKIKDNSQPNAIINSWWDFGHWFKAIADRPVTFDGASQNRPQAHWIGLALMTNDEVLAKGILRMLDCGGNTAFDTLNADLNNIIQSVDVLKQIIVLNRSDARKVLSNYIGSDKIDAVLEKTHCTPPEDFFIASDDMIGKAGVWAHFGSWDFNRAWVWTHARNLPHDEAIAKILKNTDLDNKTAENYYYAIQSLSEGKEANTWISPWPGYVTGINGCSNKGSNTQPYIICSNGVIVNMTDINNIQASLSTQQGVLKPRSLVYPVAGGIRKVTFDGKTSGYSIALLNKNNGGFSSIVMDSRLVDSMFTRMFFYKGVGLEYFELFDYEKSLTGNEVYVYKVNWNGLAKIPKNTEVRASHILVNDEKLANKLYKELVAGASFEELAKNNSIDGSAINGGDLGYFGTGTMIPVFEDAVAKLKVGQISKPIKSNFGWHIIKLTDKRLKKTVRPSEVNEESDEESDISKNISENNKTDNTKILGTNNSVTGAVVVS